VLVVDDEAPIRRMVSALLTQAGFAVEGVASGEAAVARLAAAPPIDVVLLDRSMPGAPGETFLPRMREVAPASRIILFSGQATDALLAAQVDGVLVKPASSSDIVAAISALVRQLPAS
jgi:DNA-binding response OmpR family regulator